MSGSEPENGPSLADEFADPVRPYVDPTCELVSLTADQIEDFRAKKLDPYIDRLSIAKLVGGQKNWINHPEHGTRAYFPPAGATRAWLAQTFGPGSYHIEARNCKSQVLTSCRADVGLTPGAAPPGLYHPLSPGMSPQPYAAQHAPVAAPAYQPQSTHDRFMEAILARFIDRDMGRAPPPPPPPPDPMREVVASIATLVTAMAAQRPEPPRESTADKLMLAIIPKLLDRPRENPAPSAELSIEKTINLLALGKKLFGDKKDDDDSKWLDAALEMVDSIGPAVVVGIAQAALPPDKAEAVTEAVKQHMAAREAEAKAGDDDDDEPEIVETTGATVQ